MKYIKHHHKESMYRVYDKTGGIILSSLYT